MEWRKVPSLPGAYDVSSQLLSVTLSDFHSYIFLVASRSELITHCTIQPLPFAQGHSGWTLARHTAVQV